ncbi:ABC transporter permease [Demequina iriomotensis]|uniref:ABC transporter permease n=1 Tax=Demequina iriomotensis TaxID=1536641 RepID=UPI000AF7DDFE|nr:ABC transporter permease [Demequina iriomotensis]
MSTEERIIRPRRRNPAFPLGDVLEYRDLLGILALRDVKLRYRQTAVGVAWVVIQPLLGAGIFTFVFGGVANLSTGDDNVPYFLFSFVGLMLWNVFGQILQKSTESLVGNQALVSKIFFPRIILPLSTVYGVLLDFAVSVVLLAVLMAVSHVAPGIALLAAPVALLLVVLSALGVGLIMAALNVSYRDVRYVVPVAIQFLLWMTPVAYGIGSLPEAAQAWVAVNPLVGALELFRWAVIGTPVTSWLAVAWTAVFAVTMFLVGSVYFQRAERRFADVI